LQVIFKRRRFRWRRLRGNRVVRYTAPFEATTLHADDALTTPLAADFRVRIGDLFAVV